MKKKVKSARAKPIADGAETISGRRREILRLARKTGRRELRTARERLSPSSGTLQASASRCVARRVSGNS